jgi:hypothetical protein
MAMIAGIAQIDISYRTRLRDPFILLPLHAYSIFDLSVFPEILKPTWSHLGISNRVHDIFVAYIALEGSDIMYRKW